MCIIFHIDNPVNRCYNIYESNLRISNKIFETSGGADPTGDWSLCLKKHPLGEPIAKPAR